MGASRWHTRRLVMFEAAGRGARALAHIDDRVAVLPFLLLAELLGAVVRSHLIGVFLVELLAQLFRLRRADLALELLLEARDARRALLRVDLQLVEAAQRLLGVLLRLLLPQL